MTDFTAIWNELSHASFLERLTFAVDLREIVSFIFALVLAFIFLFIRRRDYKRTAAQLHDLLAETNAKLTAAEANLDRARAETAEWRPGDWLKAAAKERIHGNEERAIVLIEDGFERVRVDLSAALVALAGHQLSLIVGHDQESHLSEGRRWAQLASELDPANRDARFLMEESRMLDWEDLEVVSESLPASYLPRDQDEANLLIRAVISAGQGLFDQGSYRFALQLFRRAELVARRADLARSEVGILARLKVINATLFTGNVEQASKALADLIPVCRRELGTEHHLTLAARHLDVQALENQGQHVEAGRKIDLLLPTLKKAQGKENPDTLLGEHLKAQILHSIEEHHQALDAVERLLPIREKILGNEHPDTLVTRYLRAQILDALGRLDDALDEVNSLLPVLRKNFGEAHPMTLRACTLRAELLSSKGEEQVACQTLTDLLPTFEVVFGRENPDNIAVQHMRACILDSIGEHQSAFDAICELLPIREKVSGVEHAHTLALRLLKAQCIRSLGKYGEALEEVADLLPKVERINGSEHSYTLGAQHLRADLLRCTGAPEQALDIITELLPVCERARGRAHPRTLSTLRLRARILADSDRGGEALAICSTLIALERPQDHMLTRLVQAYAENATGHPRKALELLGEAIGEMSVRLVPTHYLLIQAQLLQQQIGDGM